MATFVEFVKPAAPLGIWYGAGEIVGFDATTAATLIASGVAASSSAPGTITPPSLTRVKFVGPAQVGPTIYENQEVAGFPAATAAALIAQGSAVSN
jgi:hypothetical protein